MAAAWSDARPAFVAGTSAAFLGAQPPPHAVRERPVVFVLGPRGSGKTEVARRLCGPDRLELDDAALARAVAQRVRDRAWPAVVLETGDLLLEGPCFLRRRPGTARAVVELLRARADAHAHTVLTQPADGSTMRALLDAIPTRSRATVLLRFPEGRGRRRFALGVCAELGLDPALARASVDLDPWSYAAVRAHLTDQADRAR